MARMAVRIRRLANVVWTVNLVAIPLWTLLITTTLGLRCRIECRLVVNATLDPLLTRIRSILGSLTLIGLLSATRPWLLAMILRTVEHRAAAPFELAGLATSIRFRPSCSVRRMCDSTLLGTFSVAKVGSLLTLVSSWTMRALLRNAGRADIWTPCFILLRWTCVWLLRGICPRVTLRPVTTPTCEASGVRLEWGRATIPCRFLLICTCMCILLVTGLTRTLSVFT